MGVQTSHLDSQQHSAIIVLLIWVQFKTVGLLHLHFAVFPQKLAYRVLGHARTRRNKSHGSRGLQYPGAGQQNTPGLLLMTHKHVLISLLELLHPKITWMGRHLHTYACFLVSFIFAFSFLQFVQSIGLDKRPFHLVGVSMGGHVAGVYAAQYPINLSSLTLICPSGKLSTSF